MQSSKLEVGSISVYLERVYGKIRIDDPVDLPFIAFLFSDKSEFKPASEGGYIDPYNLWLVDNNGWFVPNMSFIFVDTYKFRLSAIMYEQTGAYCHELDDSPEYIKYWTDETIRRKVGATAKCRIDFTDLEKYFNAPDKDKDKYKKPVHITGGHYSYLNFGRIEATQNEQEQADSVSRGEDPKRKIEKFPYFVDGDFWYFHLKQFAADNEFDTILCKARRKGATYKEKMDSADMLNLFAQSKVLHLAYDDTYLTDPGMLSDLTIKQLRWFDEKTYWKRGIPKELSEEVILGYKEQSKGHHVEGWLSSLLSAATKVNSSNGAGKSPNKTKYEEAGIFNNILEVHGINQKANRAGKLKTGNSSIFGTGGTKDANWEGFKAMYYSPEAFDCLPLRNIWSRAVGESRSGFFYPQVWAYEPYIDKDGNSQVIDAYYADIEEKRLKQVQLKDKPSEYILFVGQGANTPEEAFYTTTDNIFSSETLNSRMLFLNSNKDIISHVDGQMVVEGTKVTFKSNIRLAQEGNQIHSFPEGTAPITGKDNAGCTRIFRQPFRNADGSVPKDLFFITYDTYGKDKDSKDINNKNSFACIDVWMYPNNYVTYTTYKVASFVGRRDTMRECDMIAYYLSIYYNAEVCPEIDRGTCVQTFKELNGGNRIMNDPTIVFDNKNQKSVAKGILIGSGPKKGQGITNLKEILYQPVSKDIDLNINLVLHYIEDYWLLYEISNYTETANLDRLSSAIIWAFIMRKFQMAHKGKANKPVKKEKHSLDKYLNSYGI